MDVSSVVCCDEVDSSATEEFPSRQSATVSSCHAGAASAGRIPLHRVIFSTEMQSTATYGYSRAALWSVFASLTIVALVRVSLPMLRVDHPMHALLYAQRWFLIPHIVAGATALVLGPLQFSRRLRARNPARHRTLGKIYLLCCVAAATFAALLARNYPAFFPYSVSVNAFLWITFTLAAFAAARRRRIDRHRRWMARSYAMATTFVIARLPLPIRGLDNLSLQASSYALLVFTLFALLVAELLVDWPLAPGPAPH